MNAPCMHSKTPWVDNEGAIENADGMLIAYVSQAVDFGFLTGEPYERIEAECSANARLVVSAPALFANLRYAVWCFVHGVAPTSDAVANMLTALGESAVDGAMAPTVNADLLSVVRFARAKFCDPYELENDPAAARLKLLADAALAKVEGGAP